MILTAVLPEPVFAPGDVVADDWPGGRVVYHVLDIRVEGRWAWTQGTANITSSEETYILVVQPFGAYRNVYRPGTILALGRIEVRRMKKIKWDEPVFSADTPENVAERKRLWDEGRRP